jgi:hypothetical protein
MVKFGRELIAAILPPVSTPAHHSSVIIGDQYT